MQSAQIAGGPRYIEVMDGIADWKRLVQPFMYITGDP